MILYALGTIPGDSFGTDAELKAESSEIAIIAALETLHDIAFQK